MILEQCVAILTVLSFHASALFLLFQLLLAFFIGVVNGGLLEMLKIDTSCVLFGGGHLR
jgi:hypothetical protein